MSNEEIETRLIDRGMMVSRHACKMQELCAELKRKAA